MKKKKPSRKANKYTLLHRSNVKFATKNLQLLSENAKVNVDLKVKQFELEESKKLNETYKLQVSNLEKRLLATEVELLRKVVKLYEDKHTTSYPQYNGNGITTSTTNTTMLGV